VIDEPAGHLRKPADWVVCGHGGEGLAE
jgi:hypothetical protein